MKQPSLGQMSDEQVMRAYFESAYLDSPDTWRAIDAQTELAKRGYTMVEDGDDFALDHFVKKAQASEPDRKVA